MTIQSRIHDKCVLITETLERNTGVNIRYAINQNGNCTVSKREDNKDTGVKWVFPNISHVETFLDGVISGLDISGME